MTYLSEILPDDGEVSSARLCLLGGFAFGFFAREVTEDREWSQMLLGQILQYQDIVRRLSPEECRHLADHLIAVYSPLAADPE